MRRIYQIIGIIIILILIYIFQDWLRTFIITSLGGYTKKETITKTEIEYRQGKIDTLAVFNHYVATNGIILNPEPIIIYKTDTIRIKEKDSIVNTPLKKYEVSVKDSLIDGKITIRNYFNGNLYDARLLYKPLFPKYIKRTDTVYKTKTITEYLSKERAKFGIGFGTDTELQNLDLLGSYTLKNGMQFIYEYSNPIQDFNVNVPQLNFQNFTFPRKGTHSIKFLYNF